MTSETKKGRGAMEEIAERLVEEYGITREGLFGENGAFLELQKMVIEKALRGEMTYYPKKEK